ncbi:MAG: hypothetical protein ABIS67_01955 [Candidatus Eisenbacteria bacterium]
MLRLILSRLAPTALGLAALVLLTPCPARAAARNLLLNPGFEERLEGHTWMPAGWDTSISGLPTTFFGRDTFLARGGNFAANVANISTMLPMAHNWSQAVAVGREAWGKDLLFTVWTRSNGVEGRAYCLLQAYRDTLSKMARTWKVPREEAASRLRINKVDDPLVDFGWKRVVFTEPQTDWVRRELRVYCPLGVNMVFVRCGVLGTGQLLIDDASLTIESALPAPKLATGVNLLADGGFEGTWANWEIGIPPYAGLHIERDSTEAHSGKSSALFDFRPDRNMPAPPVVTRIGVCQVISNRALGGKRVKLSAWVKTDSLKSSAYLKIFAHGHYGTLQGISSEQWSENQPWTLTTQLLDLPPDTYQVWAWCQYDGPARGKVHFDDVSLEVLGPVPPESKLPPVKKPAAVKSDGRSKSDLRRD